MKPTETKRLYEQACNAKRIKGNDDEGKQWHRVLREYEARDVEAALDAWWADATPTASGRPRGAFLPEPIELKPLVLSIVRKREAASREPQDMINWRCRLGHTLTTFISKSRPTPVSRLCPACTNALECVGRGSL